MGDLQLVKATYIGYLSVTYMDYTDLGTGRVLFAEPGNTYDIQPTGFNAPAIPPSDWVPAEEKKEDESSEESSDENESSPPPEVVEE
jgi:hypothetical protein